MKLKQFGLKISNSIHDLDDGFPKDETVFQKIDALRQKVEERGIELRPEIIALIEEYPDYPQVKNLLTVAYQISGMPEKGYESNDWLLKEHPNYFFAKINKVNELLFKKQYDEVDKMLHQGLTINEFLPGRTVFHSQEIENHIDAVVRYLVQTQQYDLAKNRLEPFEDILSPERYVELMDYVIESHIEHLTQMEMAPYQSLFDKYLRINPANRKIILHHEELLRKLNHLYYGPDFQREFNEILALPRQELIQDLINLIWFDLDWAFDAHLRAEGMDSNRLIHCFMMLGELRAEEAFEALLDIFRLPTELIEDIFGDFSLEAGHWPLLRTNPLPHLETIYEFATNEEYDEYNQYLPINALMELAYPDAPYRAEVLPILRRICQYLLDHAEAINADDSPFLPWGIVIDLLEIRDVEALPILIEMREAMPVVKHETQEFKDFEQTLHSPFAGRKFVKHWDSALDIYKTYSDWFEAPKPVEEEKPKPKAAPTPKVSRNAPCPCGSGKKYKRCCGR